MQDRAGKDDLVERESRYRALSFDKRAPHAGDWHFPLQLPAFLGKIREARLPEVNAASFKDPILKRLIIARVAHMIDGTQPFLCLLTYLNLSLLLPSRWKKAEPFDNAIPMPLQRPTPRLSEWVSNRTCTETPFLASRCLEWHLPLSIRGVPLVPQ